MEAALKYWNRVSKPRIQEIRADPAPRLDPVLLDRAFAFSPASTLRLQDLLTSEARISALQIFLNHRFDLAAHDDGTFDVVFRAQERNGWGNNTLQALIGVFRELPYKAITPECFNLRNQSINFASLVRWDAQKRRALASLSGPLHRDAKWRYRLEVDLRNENWDVRGSFSGLAPLLAGLNLRREAASAGIVSLSTARWNWSTGVEFSHRDFRNLIPGVVLTPGLLSSGFQLKHLARLHHELWRIPQRRFRLDSSVSSQLGRIWSQPTHSFGKLQGSLSAHWFPLSQGDDYEVLAQARSGKTMGTVPFDELFMLGVERDNDLWLRAHIGTRDGRKGSAPLGRDYFLTNWEVDKNVYQNGLISFKLGPFVDSGKVTDSSSTLGSKNWLWDTGVQLKVRVLGIGVGISYGKDLRTGNNAIYTTVAR